MALTRYSSTTMFAREASKIVTLFTCICVAVVVQMLCNILYLFRISFLSELSIEQQQPELWCNLKKENLLLNVEVNKNNDDENNSKNTIKRKKYQEMAN